MVNNKMKTTSKVLILFGGINLIHGGLHLLQFIQSVFMVTVGLGDEDTLHILFENPWLSLLWAIIGLVTLIIGMKDYFYHRKKKEEPKTTSENFLRPEVRPLFNKEGEEDTWI